MRQIKEKEEKLKNQLDEIDYLTQRFNLLRKIIQTKIDNSKKLTEELNEEKKILEEKGFSAYEEHMMMKEIEDLENSF